MHISLGTKDSGGDEVIINDEDRLKHWAIFGQTSCGKTTLMRNAALCDIEAGNGLTVIDPHGDFIKDLLQNIPSYRMNDVIYINPGYPEKVIGLNLLQSVDRSQ